MKNYFVASLLFTCFFCTAQQAGLHKSDSLSGRSYEYFHLKYEEEESRELLQAYTSDHLEKAKREKNYVEMVKAYKTWLHASDKDLQLIYADSMIVAARKATSPKLLGGAYLTKGMVLYSLKQYTQALDYYLLADNEIEATADSYLRHKVQYNIALIKYYLGDYQEAAETIQKCIRYFREEEEEQAYLQSLHFLGLCYSGMGDFASSVRTNKFAVQEEFRLKNMDLHYCFLHSEGVNHYFLGNYEKSVTNFQKALPDLISRRDFANESVAYFYIAKSLLAMEGIDRALPYFHKVDSLYEKHQYLRPDMRETYELLIGYFRDRDDKERKIYYMKRLMAVDEMLNRNYKYLAGRVYRQYNVKILLKDNEKAQAALAERNTMLFLLGTFSLAGLLVLVCIWRKYRKTQSLYLQNFNLLMEQRKASQQLEETVISEPAGLEINPEIVESVLKRLQKFEETKKYLDKEMTLVRLSTYLNSNPNYVSKIIYHCKKKKYLEYITHLRIEYIIERLEKEPRYRKYNYGALAAEAGFITAKKFSEAFLEKTGVALPFFIEELEARAGSDVK